MDWPKEPIDVVTLSAYSVAHVAEFVYDHFYPYRADMCVVVGDKASICELIDTVVKQLPEYRILFKKKFLKTGSGSIVQKLCRALLPTKFSQSESVLTERKLIVWEKKTDNGLQISSISILEADLSADGDPEADEIGGRMFRFDRDMHEIDEKRCHRVIAHGRIFHYQLGKWKWEVIGG